MPRGRRAFVLVAILALALVTVASLAQSSERTTGVRFDADGVRIDVSLEDLAGPAVREQLGSGLPQVIELRVSTHRASDGEPIAVAVRTCHVAYDLWRRAWDVTVMGDAAPEHVTVADLDTVIEACLVARSMRVATAAELERARGEVIHFTLVAVLNPRTRAETERMRRWLERPGGSPEQDESFFGTLTSLFVAGRVPDADARLEIHSQDVPVPEG